jgi:hypothetical protein
MVRRQPPGRKIISLHADSNPDRAFRGATVYTLSDEGSDEEAAALAAKRDKSAKLTRALGGDPHCCRVIVLSVHDYLKQLGPRTRPEVYNYAIEELDPELYKKIVYEMPIGLSASHSDICILKETARKLVAAMTAQLCANGQLLDLGLSCDGTSVRNKSEEYDCSKLDSSNSATAP